MICSIIVAFNPTRPPLELSEMLSQRTNVLLIDNSTDEKIKIQLRTFASDLGIIYADMKGNKGIGAAQNVGVSRAHDIGAQHVIFFDQDSMLDKVALDVLCDNVTSYSRTVFCITPGLYRQVTLNYGMRDLMSSGSGCSIETFQSVGPFEEGLFIDCVDYEWGWRCLSNGVKLVQIRGGNFQHILGSSDLRLWGFKARIDSPSRLYYQYRNIIVMCRRDYVPFMWKLTQIVKSLGKIILILMLSNEKKIRLDLIFKGVRDGFAGVLGPLEHQEIQL